MINLDKALDILEVNNPSEVKPEDLKAIAKKAKRRWHPDTIAGMQPSAEKVQEYEENFKLIDEAIAVLQSFMNGSYHNPQSAYKGQPKQAQKSSEEILWEQVPEMQATLRSVFEEVKKRKFMYTEETVVLSEGDTIKDLMNEDLKQEVPYYAVVSYFFSGYIGFILLLAGLFIGFVGGPTVQNIVTFALFVYALFQTLVCLALILPMSRFWLPPAVSDLMVKVTNFNINFFNNFVYRVGSVWHFIFGFPKLLARIFYVVVFVLYQPFILIFGHRVVRRVEKKQAYYANFADWYIQELIHLNRAEFTNDQLFHLGEMYTYLSRVKEQS
ncbi:J domain-containing protein [Emticicia sp. 17c]|uniref:J domain-containing protein n=1 Tax=Emticicia sp. 17c TaxID=3127704 RepID=UPI00301BF363